MTPLTIDRIAHLFDMLQAVQANTTHKLSYQFFPDKDRLVLLIDGCETHYDDYDGMVAFLIGLSVGIGYGKK